jgi:hypothetical protein
MLKTLRRIHNDEQGLETLQVVMIVAIAAVILALVNAAWNNWIKNWFNQAVQAVTGFFA